MNKNTSPLETKEQVALVIRLRKEKIPFYGVPNGANVEPHERFKLIAEGMETGVSDLVILKHKAHLYLEMKRREGGKQSPKQKDFEKLVTELGFEYKIARGAKEAWAIIQEFIAT